MSSAAFRYHQRPPRYVYQPGDQCLIRFTGEANNGVKTQASLRDLSTTGLSFMIHSYGLEQTPTPIRVNDVLKLEFQLPSKKQIAWFANVVRTERRSEWDPRSGDQEYILVALKFRELPPLFRKVIQQSFTANPTSEIVQLPEVAAEQYNSLDKAKFVALSFALGLSMFWITQPLSSWLSFIR